MPRPTPTTADPLDHFIAAAVRERRIAIGVSQNSLAKALGLSFQQIQKYEQGQNRIATSRLIRIARVLDCKITDFIPEEDR